MLGNFRTEPIKTLRAAEPLEHKRQVEAVAKLLSRFVPIHVSAIRYLNLMEDTSVRHNLNQLKDKISAKGEVDRALLMRVLAGKNQERTAVMKENFTIRALNLTIDGKTVRCPVVFKKDKLVTGGEPLPLLIDGKFYQVNLAESQEEKEVAALPEADPEKRSENLVLKGIGGSPGYGYGTALHLSEWEKGQEIKMHKVEEKDIPKETERFIAAIEQAIEQIEKEIEKVSDGGKGELIKGVLASHLTILNDKDLRKQFRQIMEKEPMNAEYVWKEIINGCVRFFEAAEDDAWGAKADDYIDAGKRVLKCLRGMEEKGVLDGLEVEVVVVAKRILPSDALALFLAGKNIKGIVVEEGGPTSHAVMIARSLLEVPCVVAVKDATRLIEAKDMVAIHGQEGSIIVNPDVIAVSEMTDKQRVFGLLVSQIYEEVKGKPAETADETGARKILLEGNISSRHEVAMLKHFGGDGVGLYRTEFLFMNREKAPTRKELTVDFSNLGKLPAKIRTGDFGGDKPSPPDSPWISEAETSYMGLRGVRLYSHHEWFENLVLRNIVNAVLRASARNKGLGIMVPMVGQVEELRDVRSKVEEEKTELKAKGIPFNEEIQVGIMVEVPSAVRIADELAQEADFFSIGSNDLIGYTLAVERGNPLVAHLYNPFHRSILWSFWSVSQAAKKARIPVGLCGEAAADPLEALLLAGMGIDSLSMSPADIPIIKYLLRTAKQKQLEELAQAALHDKAVGKEISATKTKGRIIGLAREILDLETYKTLSFIEHQFRGNKIT
jgi:phosphotransferase system enzyme I (PtsI)